MNPERVYYLLVVGSPDDILAWESVYCSREPNECVRVAPLLYTGQSVMVLSQGMPKCGSDS